MSLQSLREDMELVQPDLDVVHEEGEELIGLIGEPDKPEVEKNVDDLEGNWQEVTSQWAARQKLLDEALAKATSFQEQLLVRVFLIAVDCLIDAGVVLCMSKISLLM